MIFLNPIAGLVAGLVGSVLVIVYWMLKLRRRPVKVSSTLLWKKSVRDLEGNVPWQMVRPSVLLFLQLLAVVLLAMAIGRPAQDGEMVIGGGEVVIVVDAGASMNSVADVQGNTRLELSKRDAVKLVRSIGTRSAETKFRVIRAGGVAQMVSIVSGSWRQARAAIESIEGADSPSDLGAAVALVSSLGAEDEEGESVQTFVFTDSSVDDGSMFVRRPVTEFVDRDDQAGRGNLGIVLVGGQRDQADAGKCRVFVTVVGVVGETVGVRVEARTRDLVLASRAMELVPDAEGVVESAATLSFGLDSAAMLEVSILREDVLGADNTVWVMMPDPSPIVTMIVAKDGVADPLLVDVMGAVTGGVVSVVGEGESVAAGTGLLIYDRVGRDERVALPTIEVGGIGAGSGEDERLQRVLSWDRSHPTMRDVDLSGLRFTGGGWLDGELIASGRSGAVIAETAEAGVRHLAIGFGLEDSNWGVQVSMPMFFANAVRYLLPGTSGTGVVHQTGDLIGESGVVVERVGLVRVDGEEVGVSLLNRAETIRAGRVLRNDAFDSSGDVGGGVGGGRVELWRWFVLAGLVVLTLEWVLDLMRRRIV